MNFYFLTSNNAKAEHRDDQCDCACVGQSSAVTRRLLSDDIMFGVSDLQYKTIKDDYILVFNPQDTGMALATPSGLNLLESFRQRRKITPYDDSDAIHWMINSGLLLGESEDAGYCFQSSPEVITSWLHITDRCNLRCSYCYLPHVREDMLPETGRAAIDATFRSAIANNLKRVNLKYAGGEPLLRFPLIVELHQYAQSLARKHELDLEGVILSNGTLLTAEMVKTLQSLGLRMMISLDGLGSYHDAHRPYAGGRGSFSDVADAVELALSHGLTPNISVTVSSRTADGLHEVMAWILERELPFSLNFYRENELSASQEDMRLDEQKIINGMLAAFKVIEENLPRRPFLGGIIDRANLSVSHTHTCGVGQNYLVFDQNGQIAKCQMHIRKPITDVHVADPLAIIRADQIGIQNISVEEKEGCKTCEWKHWCAGGCPLATYRATGRYDVKSPNCNIYKALFPEALRLEGLRLLKYQDDPKVVVSL